MSPALDLGGRVAVVTGGATGIGAACVADFARAGANVVVNYSRSADDAEKAAESARAAGVEALTHRADVSDDTAVRQMMERVVGAFGRIDFLVNSAGTTRFVDEADLEGLTPHDWQRIWEVNVQGIFNASRSAARQLRTAGGAIVNVGSIAGHTGRGSSVAYAASKGAVATLTKSLARALAPEARVNAVAPGIVMTRWVEGREEHVRRLSAGTALGRVCEPEEVARVIVFLATEASFITGQTVIVDGGALL